MDPQFEKQEWIEIEIDTMKLLLFLIALNIFKSTNGQVEYDKSMESFCKRHNGVFEKRSKELSSKGDICTATFNVAVKDEDEALEFCEKWSPFVILDSAKRLNNFQTQCRMRAMFICKSANWKLLYGRCIMPMSGPALQQDKAVQACKTHKANIVDLNNDVLSRMFKYTFPRTPKMWVNVFGSVKILVYGITSIIYGGGGSQVVDARQNDTAFVLCQYKPSTTLPYVHFHLGLLSEVYYPSLITPNSLLFRTTNFYGHHRAITPKNPPTWDDNYCRAILRVLRVSRAFRGIQTGVFQIPHFTDELRNTSVFAHNNAYRAFVSNFINDVEPDDYKHYYTRERHYGTLPKSVWRPRSLSEWSQFRSTILLHHTDKDVVMIDASPSLRGPMWCGFEMPARYEYSCRSGFLLYKRASGEHVCFSKKMEWDWWRDIQNICRRKYKGYLAGFESEDELKFLYEIIREYDSRVYNVWLGAKRRDECLWGGRKDGAGYDDSELCNREKAFVWQNAVADNDKPVIHQYYSSLSEPNYVNGNEECLEIRGDLQDRNTRLNDAKCNKYGYGICQIQPIVNVVYGDPIIPN